VLAATRTQPEGVTPLPDSPSTQKTDDRAESRQIQSMQPGSPEVHSRGAAAFRCTNSAGRAARAGRNAPTTGNHMHRSMNRPPNAAAPNRADMDRLDRIAQLR